MPGFVIHLAIAGEHLKKYNIENIGEFKKGVIAPDLIEDMKSHYGEYSSSPNLNKFINEQGLNTSYNKGYFLHLLTDYLFYNRYLTRFSEEIYDDYDFFNRELIEKYKIDIPDEIENKVLFKNGIPQIIDSDTLEDFIKIVGSIDLDKLVDNEIDLSTIEISKSKKNKEDEKVEERNGLKEGLIYEKSGKVIPFEHLEEYLFGFENRYALWTERRIGELAGNTKGAENKLFRVTARGIASKPSEIRKVYDHEVTVVQEGLNENELQKVKSVMEEALGREVQMSEEGVVEELSTTDCREILKKMQKMEERQARKKIASPHLNKNIPYGIRRDGGEEIE